MTELESARMAYNFHMSAHGCERQPNCPIRQALYKAWAQPEHMTDEDRRLAAGHHLNFDDDPLMRSGEEDRRLDQEAERALHSLEGQSFMQRMGHAIPR